MNKPPAETLERLRLRIAELAGWTDIREQDFYASPGNSDDIQQYWAGVSPDGEQSEIPPFAESLDAMHDAEAALLTDANRSTYLDALYEIVNGFRWNSTCETDGLADMAFAEAWQRAVALDRTLSPDPII